MEGNHVNRCVVCSEIATLHFCCLQHAEQYLSRDNGLSVPHNTDNGKTEVKLEPRWFGNGLCIYCGSRKIIRVFTISPEKIYTCRDCNYIYSEHHVRETKRKAAQQRRL